MLEIKNITKIYKTGSFTQKALNKVNINFRENEFVSILGPSGSGKTTLLNVIGGLDKYDSGDLVINEVSTKKYKDKDWDTYRNHRIGFIFQSYNLIPHQTVLSNVELALTLSGIGKRERRKRAIKALKEVGLGEHIHKKPNQMSGGQMQRVAIARALINNPDILLADEPTGALDSETSVQIMNLLKKISKDKLVIMVTHNPELANEYSNRIISLKDGEVINDTNPYDGKDKIDYKTGKSKKTSMSFFTALSLSLNNLMTKKARTILTAFAGSIGIIGIALILSLSNGVNNYIAKVQEDTLTSYPLTIEKNSVDTATLMSSFMGQNSNDEHGLDAIYSNNIMTDMISTMYGGITTNNLIEFKKYLDNNKDLKKYVNDIKYTYNLDLQIYTNASLKVNPSNMMSMFNPNAQNTNSSMSGGIQIFNELTTNKTLLNSQYEVISGKMPESYDEMVLIVDENNEIVDYVLYAIGLKDQKEIQETMMNMMNGNEIQEFEQTKYSYEDILNTDYKLVLNSDYYKKENGVWVDKSNDLHYLSELVDNGIKLNIVGIIKPKDGSNISITNGIGYTKELSEYVINEINESEIVKEQLENQNINVFTNQEFKDLETLENNLSKMGAVDLDNPYTINIYPKDFESKDKIEEIINKYNDSKIESGDEEDKIEYTDYVGLLMSSVTTIVDVIGYVLIAFVSISLVVSSIMIGIITYISVLERTKEIGILRSIGASKKDISRVFNAETFIVGLTSGGIGILITCILNVFINILIKNVTGVVVSATLPIKAAIILIIISTLLTMIAGLIPSKIASKKDPVIALRTE
ncbi:MAG: ABC transporter ATP-binding protein/permease [Firmicutes bacterium]|nr:ABC transporter ATP-binding protein/permease [Bacillota bacterium]